MANTASARKRARQAEKNRQHNVALRSRLRTAIKRVLKTLESGDKKLATEAYQRAVPIIDTSVNKKLIHKNKAARHKSHLNRLLQRF